MEIISFDGRRKNIGSDKFEVNNEHEILNRWESLSVDDMIFTANCIKAAGVRNYKEFRKAYDIQLGSGEIRSITEY